MNLKALAYQLRRDTIDIICAGKAGHIGGDMSVMEVLVELYFDQMNIDAKNPEDPDQEECFISQATPVSRNILERFHFYCTIMPCEMGHADISHVPTDKSFIRPEMIFHKYRMRNNPFSVHSNHSHTYNPSDPLTYYVYGLRKIII